MKLYTVTDAYIAYLKGIDSKVLNNYGGIRPYVGIIIEIGGHKYLAPLTSYKAKQEKLNNNLPTIFKVHEKGDPSNKPGLIQLNNMIPVLESEIILIDRLPHAWGLKEFKVTRKVSFSGLPHAWGLKVGMVDASNIEPCFSHAWDLKVSQISTSQFDSCLPHIGLETNKSFFEQRYRYNGLTLLIKYERINF